LSSSQSQQIELEVENAIEEGLDGDAEDKLEVSGLILAGMKFQARGTEKEN
jgi:hypothetical protein